LTLDIGCSAINAGLDQGLVTLSNSGEQSVYGKDKGNHHQGRVNQFGIPSQPIGQINIKIIAGSISISSRNESQWTIKFKQQQGQAFQDNQTKT